MSQTLFEELGGAEAVKAVVNSFYDVMLQDPEIAPYFENTDMAKQRQHQALFIGSVLGGTEAYPGRDMKAAHAGMEIDNVAFFKVIGHLAAALARAGVPDEHIDTIVSTANGLRTEIVERP